MDHLDTIRAMLSDGIPATLAGPPSHSDWHNAVAWLTGVSEVDSLRGYHEGHREHHHLLGVALLAVDPSAAATMPAVGPQVIGDWHTPRVEWEIATVRRIVGSIQATSLVRRWRR